jgi:hypothetical protein
LSNSNVSRERLCLMTFEGISFAVSLEDIFLG